MAKSTSTPNVRPLHWRPNSILSSLLERADGMTLFLSITEAGGEGWLTTAAETRVAIGEDDKPTAKLAEVLGNHAHQVLAPKATIREALEQAEAYAAWWRASGAVHEECDCEPIADGAPPSLTSS